MNFINLFSGLTCSGDQNESHDVVIQKMSFLGEFVFHTVPNDGSRNDKLKRIGEENGQSDQILQKFCRTEKKTYVRFSGFVLFILGFSELFEFHTMGTGKKFQAFVIKFSNFSLGNRKQHMRLLW